jgi:spore germination protein
MITHIVQPGDTVNYIANMYGISPDRLILENEITNPDRMAIGETLLIVYPKLTYIVQEGDTLSSIADAHGVSWTELLRNNPYISDREELIVGEEIVIQFVDEKKSSITVNGYAFPYINIGVLKKTLPFLTYLTIIGCRISSNGSIGNIDDIEIIRLARDYGVGALMQIFTHTDTTLDNNEFQTILYDYALQDILINNILTMLRSKGYYGANIDTPYIQPGDKELYVEFIMKLTRQLNKEGFLLITSLSPNTFEVATGITYTGIDYTGISQAANNVIYNLSYDWANPFELPKSALSFETITMAVSNAATYMAPEKLLLGVTSVGYLWQLPYVSGTTATTFINHTNAINIARENGIDIQFNEINQSSYIHYVEIGREYMVLFKDVRAMAAFPALIQENNLSGISFFNIMYYFPRTWLLFHSQFEINKALPLI